mmetsp:Transcript_44090/g.104970  ORF Transcript_44090/g.104970 Transcript_44090/m.104970 type:complete len:408 (+) Transcript_44090:772-1995(+)
MLQEPPADGVPSLVVGDARALLLGEDLALLLEAADHALDRRLEVHHPHHRLGVARGDERRFVAYVCDVRAGEARREGGHALRHLVEAVAQLDLLQVNLVDLEAAANVGLVDLDLPVEPARAEEGGVEDVGTVRPRQHHNPSQRVEPVHLDEELVEGVLALVVAASGEAALAARAADRVDLVDEHDARRVRPRLGEEVADARRAHAHEHLDEVRPRDREERHARLARHGLGEQRLARPRRAAEEGALGDLGAEDLELVRVLEELHELVHLHLGLLEASDVSECDLLLLVALDDRGLRLEHLEDVPRTAATPHPAGSSRHLAHDVEPDGDDQDGRRELQHLPGPGGLVAVEDRDEVLLLKSEVVLRLFEAALEGVDAPDREEELRGPAALLLPPAAARGRLLEEDPHDP